MHFTVLAENLRHALSIVKRNPSNSSLPVLENILIETEKGKIRLTTTNLDLGTTITIGGKVEKEGKITISYRLFSEFINTISANKINIQLKDENLLVKSEYNQAIFTTIPASEFPPFPKKNSRVFTIPENDILLISKQIAFAASNDEGRPVLTGIIFKPEGDHLLVAATDGFRLSVRKFSASYGQDIESIIPARTLVEIARINNEISEEEIDIDVFYAQGKNQLIFSLNETDIFSRLIEGEFPDFKKIIPSDKKTKVTVEKEVFQRAIKAASLFARESANIVRIYIKKNKLIISSNTPQLGSQKATVEAKIVGEENEIAFNFRFLIDFLNSVEEKTITFQMTNPLSPCLFQPQKDKVYSHVIMPVRVEAEE